MARCALLLKAAANRVYGESAFALAVAELGALGPVVAGSALRDLRRETIAGVDYLVVDCEPDGSLLAVLSNLSSLHALFVVEGDRFRPLPIAPRRCHDEDLVTIQRYAGKTNEAFTHLLVNVALAAAGDAFTRLLAGERLRLLDPVCGRGTTLNRAVVYGLDAVGVDLDQRDVDAFEVFFLTWLKDKRLKHTVERARLRRARPTPARRLTVTYGAGKDRASHRVVDVIHDDTVRLRDHVQARSVDLLVCDLPYGVAHGSRSDLGGLARDPEALLAAALPGWLDALRPGAAAALAWNRRTLSRARLVELFREAGFAVLRGADDDAFVHRVDRAILRDVVVAVRPA